VAAYNAHEFTTPPLTEQDTYAERKSSTSLSFTPSLDNGVGPIPYCTRYTSAGSVAFLYVQTDRPLVVSGAMTTTSNYTIIGTSAPTITAVSFTTSKSYIQLTLSTTIPTTEQYSLKVNDNTFTDNNVFNIVTAIPIFIDYPTIGVGIAETINIGSPVMSYT
jgi:hypothetical protein